MRDEEYDPDFDTAREPRGIGSAHVPDFSSPPSSDRDTGRRRTLSDDDEPLPPPRTPAADTRPESVDGVRLRIEERVEESLHHFAHRLAFLSKSVGALTSRLRDAGIGGEPIHVAHDLAERGQHIAHTVAEIDVRGAAQRLERELDEHPVRTLAIAVAAGWVVGRIVR